MVVLSKNYWTSRAKSRHCRLSDPEVVLDPADPNNDANLDEDYEGYEGYYDDENEGSFASNDSASASQESSQGRLFRISYIEMLNGLAFRW